METYITLSIILLSAFCIGFILIREKQNINFVLNNSVLLKKLIEINKKYNFYDEINNFDEKYIYDNEKFYNNISCQDFLIYQLQFKKYDIETEIKNIKYNKIKYKIYCEEILKIGKFGEYEKPTNKFRTKYLLKIEKKLFERMKLKPVTQFCLAVRLYCSKINGEIYTRKTETFLDEEIMSLIARLNNKRGAFYNDREIWESLCRVERGKVSNKMRFSIYQRDGYRCRYCGRSENSDYLEIDHIKPIAKGGKSVYENLQTLCRRCNKNKSDTF